MGVAALPACVANESLRSQALVPLLAGWSLPSQEIHAVYPSPRLVPAKVNDFIGWLQVQFGASWWIDGKPT